MTFTDRLRPFATKLFETMANPAAIETAGTKTINKITGAVTVSGSSTKSVMAALGARRIAADDGTIRVQSIAKVDSSAKAGDKLVIGTKTMTISDVEEVAPDGGEPLLWVVVLR